LLAVFLIVAVSCHPLAVVTPSIFGTAELTWSLVSRRIRWGVWSACLIAAVPFLVSLPVLLGFRSVFGRHFWSLPTWGSAISTYGAYLGLDVKLALVLIVLFGIVAGGAVPRRPREFPHAAPENDFSLPELVLLGAFLLYPALLAVLTKLLHSGYIARYGWPAIFGLVLASVYLLRSTWAASAPLVAALLVAFAYQAHSDISTVRKPGSTTVDERWARLEALCREEPGVPVVIGNPIDYLEALQYSPPGLRDRLVEVVDPDQAVRLLGADTPDRANRILAQFVPLRVEDLKPFEAANPRFILRSGGTFDWFTEYLVESNYRLRLLSGGRNIPVEIYLAER
jgi:hypothetical protein